jgi:DNA-binding transcriptional MerR regulator
MNHRTPVTQTRYSIGQVFALTGVPKSTLRFWEKEFAVFLQPQRTEGKQRRYTQIEVETIRTINHLVSVEGYTLDGVRRKLRVLQEQTPAPARASKEKLNELAESMSEYLLKKVFAMVQLEDTQRSKFF